MANQDEYKSTIGLDSLYYALITEDSAAAYTAGTPAWLAPAAEMSVEPQTDLSTQYADDQPYDVFASEAESKITLTITGLDAQAKAVLTGKRFDAASGRVFDNVGIPPYVAIGGRALKSNGSYHYFWFLKAVFATPKLEFATKADAPDPKTLTLECTAIKTVHKFDQGGSVDETCKGVSGDEDTDNFVATTWFSQVQTPVAVAPSALSLSSSVPTDGATGIVVSADQTLTFNNTLPATAVNHIVLCKASDGTIPAGSITLDSTKKIVTINPTSSLTGATAYIITYAVTDIYGQSLSGVINFTTA